MDPSTPQPITCVVQASPTSGLAGKEPKIMTAPTFALATTVAIAAVLITVGYLLSALLQR